MGLDELAPVGGRAAGGRHWRRLEWFTQVRENLPDRSRLSDKRDQPDASDRKWVEARTQFHPWNCVLPALKQDLIGELPKMRRSGRTDASDLPVSVNALRPVSETVCERGEEWWRAHTRAVRRRTLGTASVRLGPEGVGGQGHISNRGIASRGGGPQRVNAVNRNAGMARHDRLHSWHRRHRRAVDPLAGHGGETPVTRRCSSEAGAHPRRRS
jgi:hypothetical protein